MKRYAIIALVLAAAAAWFLSGQLGESDRRPEAAMPSAEAVVEDALPQVRVRRQAAVPRTAEIVLRGRTVAERAVEVSAETRGSVKEVLVERGSAVAAGDVILRLAQDDRLARLRQTKALQQQRQIEFDAATKLAAKGYRAEVSVAEAHARLEEAKAAVASMEIDIGYTTIAAPFAGVLDERQVEIGDFVDVGDTVATVVDLDPILVVAQVGEHEVGRVAVGAPGRAMLATGKEVSGRVSYISSVADEQTRTFRIELEVANADRQIVQGVSAELRLPGADLPAHSVSPAILALDENGAIGVKIVNDDNVVEFVPVTIIADDGRDLWLAGLPGSITLITVGQEYVKAGQQVQPVPESQLPAAEPAP